jgi:hypothetical protein
MKWTIDTSSLPGFLTVKTVGAPATGDSHALWDELLTNDHWHSGMCILFDNRKLERYPSDGTGSEMISAALNFFESRIETIGNSRIAVLIGPRENFIYHRQFQYGLSLRGLPVNMQMFFKEKEAKEWLGSCTRAANA